MLDKGTTFIRAGHVWFNISEPTATNRKVLCVNLTCLDDECPDDECTISPVEYSWVKEGYLTTVAFSRAKVWDADNILACLKNGTLSQPGHGNIPANTISKVVKIALSSKELSDNLKDLLR